jgi:hypothetical protein
VKLLQVIHHAGAVALLRGAQVLKKRMQVSPCLRGELFTGSSGLLDDRRLLPQRVPEMRTKRSRELVKKSPSRGSSCFDRLSMSGDCFRFYCVFSARPEPVGGRVSISS